MIVVIGHPSYRAPDAGVGDRADGRAVAIARAAARAVGQVQLVGKIGDDAAGDALVLALARDDIGHAAVLRDPGRPTPLVAPEPLTSAWRAGIDGAAADDSSTTDELLAGDDLDEPLDRATSGVAVSDLLLPADPAERPALDAADIGLALRYLADITVIVAADPLDEASAQVVAEAGRYAGAHIVVVLPHDGHAPGALEGEGVTVLEAPNSDPEGSFAVVIGRYAAELAKGTRPAEAFAAATSATGWEPATA